MEGKKELLHVETSGLSLAKAVFSWSEFFTSLYLLEGVFYYNLSLNLCPCTLPAFQGPRGRGVAAIP